MKKVFLLLFVLLSLGLMGMELESCKAPVPQTGQTTCWDSSGSVIPCAGTWQQALDFANGLADGQCGLEDGSMEGDSYLPNRNQLTSPLDLQNTYPALPTGHPFMNFQSDLYWSSTTLANFPLSAWVVNFGNGFVFNSGLSSASCLQFVVARDWSFDHLTI